MIYNIFYKNLEPAKQLEQALSRKISKVEHLLPTFDDDSVKLDISFERNVKKEEYYTSLTLALPRKTLRAKEKGFDIINSMNLAFDEMLREIKKFKALLKREHTYKTRRAEKKQGKGITRE